MKTFDITEKFARSADIPNNLGMSCTSLQEKHSPGNKIPEDNTNRIIDHIKSFPTVESHYCRNDTAKQYLEENLNVTEMYDFYVQKCNNE